MEVAAADFRGKLRPRAEGSRPDPQAGGSGPRGKRPRRRGVPGLVRLRAGGGGGQRQRDRGKAEDGQGPYPGPAHDGRPPGTAGIGRTAVSGTAASAGSGGSTSACLKTKKAVL